MRLYLLVAACAVISACKGADLAENIPAIKTEVQADMLAVNPLRNAYFGDLHVHTGNSFDAFIFNVKATPDDAYRYAKGEAIKHPGRFDIQIDGPPLDFYAVTDHGEYLGILRAMKDKKNPLSEVSLAKDMSFIKPEKLRAAFGKISQSTRSGVAIAEIEDQTHMNSVWQSTIDAANAHYKPGEFTTFAGYEFSSVKARDPNNQRVGGNLHRNVIFKARAPEQLFTTLDSANPEDLWRWMDRLRAKGVESLAVPHNSNVSDGHMFSKRTYDGGAMDADYARARMRNEPLVEITQVKGTSEVHPSKAPNDEWADFEIYEDLLNTQIKGHVDGSYIRAALRDGLGMNDAQGFNPFKFGFIGSSDTHVAGSGFTEKNHWGKMGFVDGKAKQRGSVLPRGAKTWDGVAPKNDRQRTFGKWSASGLAGIWAEENTRESLFEGLRRKEAFATSGPRISVRLFAGHDYDETLTQNPNMIKQAYATGVPMGGTIKAHDKAVPLLIWASRDALAAPLERLQIVKTWAGGEQVFDVACADGVPNAETYRCPPQPSDVDMQTCDVNEAIGASNLQSLWNDPTYTPRQDAAYYVRVLQIPTCRWSTWDALKAGDPPNPNFPAAIQERAWSSPIWVEAAD